VHAADLTASSGASIPVDWLLHCESITGEPFKTISFCGAVSNGPNHATGINRAAKFISVTGLEPCMDDCDAINSAIRRESQPAVPTIIA